MVDITGTDGEDGLIGSESADLIRGLAGNDFVSARGGNDRIEGGDGRDWLDGGFGDDLIFGESGDDVLDGGDGTDILYGGDGSDTFTNTSDSAIPGAENDQMYGEGGHDILNLYITTLDPETVVLDGGTGDDQVYFHSWYYIHQVALTAGDGADRIDLVGGGTVTLDAGAGDDVIRFNYGMDTDALTLTLGAGRDLVEIRTGDSYHGDTLPTPVVFTDFAGGAAGDRLSHDGSTGFLGLLDNWDHVANPFATGHLALTQRAGVGAVLSLDFDGGGDEWNDYVIFEGTDAATLGIINLGFNPDGSVTGGLQLDGTTGGEVLFGSGEGDLLRGLDGNDILSGNSGNDVIEGGAGDDDAESGSGNDRMYGGADNDRLTDRAGLHDELYGEDGNDVLMAERPSGVPAATLLLDGGAGNDVLDYGPADSVPYRLHHDIVTLIGGDGNDEIYVSRAGTATIDAGAGNDWLFLNAWLTDYTITLGAGMDTIRPSYSGAPGSMIVADFATGDAGDRLEIDYYVGGRNAVFTAGDHPYAEGFARWVQRGADAVLQVDRDGRAGSGGFVDLMTLQNVDANALTSYNLDGHSQILGTAASETLHGTAAADAMRGLGGNDTIEGEAGNDGLDGGAGNDLLRGEDGDDILDGGTGNDVLVGGLGDDWYYVDSAVDAVVELAGQGADRVLASVSYALAASMRTEALSTTDDAGTAAINLSGNEQAQTITGNAGSNVLDGRGGADTLIGLGGDDWYYVDSAGDVVVELANDPGNPLDGIPPGTAEGVNDRVLASVSYTLGAGVEVERLTTSNNSGTAAIALTGNAFGQAIYGNAGVNVLNGGGGADTLVGLGGNDWYYVDGADDVVSEAVGGGTADRIVASVSYTLGAGAEVEQLVTSDNASFAAISFTGNELANALYGNAGNNLLEGRAGNDALVGLDGFDTLVGGAGDDVMTGGRQDDLYYVDSAGDRVFEVAGEGSDQVLASVSYTLTANSHVEILETTSREGAAAINLTGNGLRNSLVGNAGANVLDGGGGADWMAGRAGDDLYYADHAGDAAIELPGEGTDRVLASVSYTLVFGTQVELLTTTHNAGTAALALTGNNLANTIYGNAGANVLDGKEGADILVGLAGADSFAFTTALEAGNVDMVSGFVVVDDTIRLENAVFIGLAAGGLAIGAFNTGTAATQADDRIIYNSATGALLFDADGLGGAAGVQFAALAAGLALTSADFLVV